jgi:hypothetical protein
MGFRKTGEKRIREEYISEMYCDVCGKTIPENQYPQYTLEIDWVRYRYEGDQVRLEVCSPECLITKANELKK